MHKIQAKEFTLDDFSHEHLAGPTKANLLHTIHLMNLYRNLFVNWDEKTDDTKNAMLVGTYQGGEYDKKDAWWQMVQLLPSSYNQRRTVMVNYEVLANIRQYRWNHKLDEWREFCRMIDGLPYSEIIACSSEEEHEDIPFDSKLEATNIISQMNGIIAKNGFASVADFMELAHRRVNHPCESL